VAAFVPQGIQFYEFVLGFRIKQSKHHRKVQLHVETETACAKEHLPKRPRLPTSHLCFMILRLDVQDTTYHGVSGIDEVSTIFPELPDADGL
jgi:hypothetical protein